MFTVTITSPELLAQLEEVRQAGGYDDFEQVVGLLMTKASALDALQAPDEAELPASAQSSPVGRLELDRFVAADAAAARELATQRGHAETTSIEETGLKDIAGAWSEFSVYAAEPAGE